MYKIITFIFFICFYQTFTQAEIINKITVSGNQRVSFETIKIYGNLNLNKDFSEEDLNKTLNNLYSTNFFEDIKIDFKNGILNIVVTEYPIINKLLLTGEENTKYKDQIKKLISSKQSDSFIKNKLAGDVEIIKKLYASQGYNFVTIDTKVRELNKSNVDLIFEVKKGEPTKIKKISFTGDKKVREKRLRDIIASEENKFWKVISRNTRFSENLLNLDVRLLNNYYKSLGYYDVKILSKSAIFEKDNNNVEIIYSIDAGNRYIIKKITTDVDPVFDKNLFYSLNKSFKKTVGSYYSPFKIKNLLEDIDEVIEQKSLQFVEHKVEEIVQGDSIEIIFKIYEGTKVLVERIDIVGNNVTNENVIRSELLLDEGDPFTKLKLEKSISRIKSRNIFGIVEYTIAEGSKPDLKTINIVVEEKPTGELSAGAGIGTSGGQIGFKVSENNWLGEGKNVSFDVSATAESLKGTLNYTNPNYDFLGNSLNYNFSRSANDRAEQGWENNVYSAGVGTRFEQYKDLYASLGINASHDELTAQSNATKSIKGQAGTFNEFNGAYGFSYDKRNRSFMPTSGYVIGFDQTIPFYADKNYIANNFFSSTYKSLNENVVGAIKTRLQSVNGLNNDNVRLNKRKYLGPKQLRGFKQVGPRDGLDHIGGNYAAVVNLEASLPKLLPESTKTDVNVFLDFGNVWGVDYDESIDESSKIRSSVGTAASWMSPLGPMTFVFSKNITKAKTDVTESFSFNLGTTF